MKRARVLTASKYYREGREQAPPAYQQSNPSLLPAHTSCIVRTVVLCASQVRGLRAAAYAAFCEAIVQTQSQSGVIARAIFSAKTPAQWDLVWDGMIDAAHVYKLRATTAFNVTSEASRLSLQPAMGGQGASRAPPAGYLPSQALLESSLSQDVDGGTYGSAVGYGGGALLSNARARSSGAGGVSRAEGAPPSQSASQVSQHNSNTQSQAVGEVRVKAESDGSHDGGGDLNGATDGDGDDSGIVLVQGYELDSLSMHPLMGTLLRTIAELRKRGLEGAHEAQPGVPSGAGATTATGMPLWMYALLLQMLRNESSPTSLNRRLLIGRLAYNLTQQELRSPTASASSTATGDAPSASTPANTQSTPDTNAPTFERYARLWARPLLRLVYDSLLVPEACFHYLARDLLCMVTGWQRAYTAAGAGDVLPTSGEEAAAVETLLADLVEKLMFMCGSEATVGDAQSISQLVRENMRIVKLLMESWPTRLKVRRLILSKMMKLCKESSHGERGGGMEQRTRVTAIHLLAAVIANGFDVSDDPAWTPQVRQKDGSYGAYKPLPPDDIPKALFALVRDVRPPKPPSNQPQTPRKAIVQPASAVFGMVLSKLDERGARGDGAASALLTSLVDMLLKYLYSLRDNTQESLSRLLLILHEVSEWYPKVLLTDRASFALCAQSFLTKVYGQARIQVLDCLTRCVQTEPQPVEGADAGAPTVAMGIAGGMPPQDSAFRVELRASDLQLVLRQTQAGVQLAALRLVSMLASKRGARAVYPYVPVLVSAFAEHKDKACRVLHLRLLVSMHDRVAADAKATAPVDVSAVHAAPLVKSALLRGLSDADEGNRCPECSAADGDSGGGRPNPQCSRCEQGLRAELSAFWHRHVLENTLPARLSQCFSTLHCAEAEDRWLHYCGGLLLQLPLDAPNAARALFDRPLEEGLTFEHHSDAVPAASSASFSMRPWGSQQGGSSQDGGGSSQYGGPLRATQSQRLFSQTQTQGGGADGGAAAVFLSTYSSQSTAAASVLWAVGVKRAVAQVPRFEESPAASQITPGSQSQSQSQTAGLAATPSMGKRFKLSTAARSEATGARAGDVMRARARAASGTARSALVAAFRSYRKGELPDIQIGARDLLAPLQALVHHDSLVAKLTFGQLYTAVCREQLGVHTSAIGDLHAGVAALLHTRQGGPAFVGCLHELALSESGSDLLWLPADAVADSARQSGNLHSGIRILERHLLSSDSHAGGTGGRAGKRGRTSSAADAGSAASEGERSVAMGVKSHLADLYRGIGDEDVVRGISAEIASSDMVRGALIAEARGDASEALALYSAALDEPRGGGGGGGGGGDSGEGGWERALATRGALAARSLLSQWTEIGHTTRLQMAQACLPPAGGEEDSTDAPKATTFKGSLSQAWVRLWVVSHAKEAGRADGVGWGTWPGSLSASDGGSTSSYQHPPGAPQPRRDAGKLLEAGHASLLLLDRLASEDLNGLRALLPRCVHAFVRRWATLHPLAEAARLVELRTLQIFAEAAELTVLLEEVPPFVEDEASGAWLRSPAHRALLRTWSTRMPSVAHHDTSAWDDLICSRQRMLATLRQATERALGEQVRARGAYEGRAHTRADVYVCMYM